MTINSLERYILEFTAFEEEPLHILFGTLVDCRRCESLKCAIRSILKLLQEQYLKCYHHSGWGGDKYKICENLTEDDLQRYINIHEPQKFKEYPSPEEGGEYYFSITDKGRQLISDVYA